MDLAAGMIGNHAVHEIQELDPAAALIMTSLDQASGNLKGGEQGRGPVTFVGMAEPGQRGAIGQLQPALGALQTCPWLEQGAWMCGFSSTANTTAFSGGCK